MFPTTCHMASHRLPCEGQGTAEQTVSSRLCKRYRDVFYSVRDTVVMMYVNRTKDSALSPLSPPVHPSKLHTFLPLGLPPPRPGAHSLLCRHHHTFWKSTCTVLSSPTFGPIPTVTWLLSPLPQGNCCSQDVCVLSLQIPWLSLRPPPVRVTLLPPPKGRALSSLGFLMTASPEFLPHFLTVILSLHHWLSNSPGPSHAGVPQGSTLSPDLLLQAP